MAGPDARLTMGWRKGECSTEQAQSFDLASPCLLGGVGGLVFSTWLFFHVAIGRILGTSICLVYFYQWILFPPQNDYNHSYIFFSEERDLLYQ